MLSWSKPSTLVITSHGSNQKSLTIPFKHSIVLSALKIGSYNTGINIVPNPSHFHCSKLMFKIYENTILWKSLCTLTILSLIPETWSIVRDRKFCFTVSENSKLQHKYHYCNEPFKTYENIFGATRCCSKIMSKEHMTSNTNSPFPSFLFFLSSFSFFFRLFVKSKTQVLE